MFHFAQLLAQVAGRMKAGKISRPKPRIWLTTSANASPTANMAVVLLLGARPKGQASSNGPSRWPPWPPGPSVLSAAAGDGDDRHAQLGQRRQQADDFFGLAALRKHQHNVFPCTRPRSPCTASAGCRKWLGVPVDASVAMIFWPTRPALPMPVTMTFPRQWRSQSPPGRTPGPAAGPPARCAALRLHDLTGETQLLEGGRSGSRPGRLVLMVRHP